MNPFRRLLDFVSYPSHSRTMGILAFLIVVLAIPLTVNIAQKQQELRQHAAGLTQCEQNGGTCDGGACGHLINKCLNDSYTDSVGTPPGCTGGRGASCNADNTAHNYSCYESLSFSCAPPAAEPAAPPSPPATVTPAQSSSANEISCATTPTCPTAYIPDARPNNRWSCVSSVGTFATPTCSTSTSTISCPGSGVPSNPHSGNTQEWGGPCTNGVDTARATTIPNTCSCTVAQCLQYNSGPYCWVNNGQRYDNVAADCAAKGASLPASCLNPSSCPSSGDAVTPTNPSDTFAWGGSCTAGADKYLPAPGTNKYYYEKCQGFSNGALCWFNSGIGTPLTCPATNPPQGSGCQTTTLPVCDTETTVTTCQATTNTCNGTGSRSRTLDKLSTGGQCTAKAPELINCNLSSAINNCSAGNACQNGPGPSGQCVAQATPPPTVLPLPTPGPGNTILYFTLGLDGLGSTGDNKNPFNSSGSNKNPNRRTRNVFAQLVDSSGNLGPEKIGYMKFTADGKFDAGVNLGAAPLGTYTVRVSADGYLWRLITAPLTIVEGDHIYTLSSVVNLVNGDLDGDNLLTASDFNILSDCFKNNSASTSCDLDDDGKITLFDLNLFLREFPVQHGD